VDDWLKDPVDSQENDLENEIYNIECTSYIFNEKRKELVSNLA
jgi:hypothetical protein